MAEVAYRSVIESRWEYTKLLKSVKSDSSSKLASAVIVITTRTRTAKMSSHMNMVNQSILPMVEDETQSWVRERLIHHWTAISGSSPDQGGFTPKGDTLDKLISLREKRGDKELDEWVKLSIAAFLHRTRGSATKFFVNSYLLSESALGYLKEFKKQDGAYSALPNNLNIRSRILISETDFLDTIITINVSRGEKKLDLTSSSFKPDVWWILSAEISGRISRDEIPNHWLSGTYQISMGNRITVEDEYYARRKELRSSSLMRDLLLTEFRISVSESTISWLESHKLATAVSEGGVLVIASSSIDQGLINPSANPRDRDEKLILALRSVMGIRRLDISRQSKRVNGMDAGSLIKAAVDPLVQKLMAASDED